jgi:hypothetical protein
MGVEYLESLGSSWALDSIVTEKRIKSASVHPEINFRITYIDFIDVNSEKEFIG